MMLKSIIESAWCQAKTPVARLALGGLLISITFSLFRQQPVVGVRMAENHVLVVEDEAKIAELLRDYLVTAGFLVTCVRRGDLAIAEVRKITPALVLLDIMLPGMDGIGIQPPDFERIFGIFQRVASSPDRPGTGAGLANCKRIVEHRGRRIWVESEPGKSSTSFLTISDPKVRDN